jgi:hypothetical protein
MQKTETLRSGRNLLLKLHKTLIDRERSVYEDSNGPMNAGQFLNVLLEDPDLAWLRKFSTLIVEIDEMFDQKDGVDEETVDLNIEKLRELVSMEIDDEGFKEKYQAGLQQDATAAGLQGELKTLLK